MASSIPNPPNRSGSDFGHIVTSFLSTDGLPFDSVLPENRIREIFAKHGGLFGGSGMYNTVVVLWAFLGQVLKDGKEAACQSAVACIIAHCEITGKAAPTTDTGDYCVARAKLSEEALHELSKEVAKELEAEADESWLWKNMHPKLIDGFTFTMPDTAKNQRIYPQIKAQKPGVGFPIARAVALLSLATAAIMDLAVGPYAGKETGETALLRSIMKSLNPGDIAVMDRYYCSFMMLALLLNQGTHSCARKHHLRHSDFRRGRRLGKYDHVIIWTRPQRPSWMDEELYATIPETLELREIRFNIVIPGRRTRSLDIITTLIDSDKFTKHDIADLYGFRWNSELDIRSIKCSLNLGHVRCKSPEMVRRELWTTLLAYNLIRTTAASAALLHDKQPRQISFTSTCQFVLAAFEVLGSDLIAPARLENYMLSLLKQIAACEVGNRPGRLEPRVLKRRQKPYKLMQKPREVLRAELRHTCT